MTLFPYEVLGGLILAPDINAVSLLNAIALIIFGVIIHPRSRGPIEVRLVPKFDMVVKSGFFGGKPVVAADLLQIGAPAIGIGELQSGAITIKETLDVMMNFSGEPSPGVRGLPLGAQIISRTDSVPQSANVWRKFGERQTYPQGFLAPF